MITSDVLPGEQNEVTYGEKKNINIEDKTLTHTVW